ncbi:branched-chain amino acid transport system permease protein [Azospirillaceae bacterium]
MTSLQLLINALALGAAYALVALGFVLTLNATGAVNFAHGDLVMIGGVLAAVLAEQFFSSLPGVVLLPIIMIVMAGLGVLVAMVGYLPLQRRSPVAVFISTIAVGIILQNSALVFVGPEPRAAPALFDGGATVFLGLSVSRQSLAIIVAATLLIFGQCRLFSRTRLGRCLRAAAQDPDMARACGVPVTTMVLLTFGLAADLLELLGCFLGVSFLLVPLGAAI